MFFFKTILIIIIINRSYKAHYTWSPNALYKVKIEKQIKLDRL